LCASTALNAREAAVELGIMHEGHHVITAASGQMIGSRGSTAGGAPPPMVATRSRMTPSGSLTYIIAPQTTTAAMPPSAASSCVLSSPQLPGGVATAPSASARQSSSMSMTATPSRSSGQMQGISTSGSADRVARTGSGALSARTGSNSRSAGWNPPAQGGTSDALQAETQRRQAAEARVRELEALVTRLRSRISSLEASKRALIANSGGENGNRTKRQDAVVSAETVDDTGPDDDAIDKAIRAYLDRNPDFPVSIQKVAPNHYTFGDRGTVYVTQRGDHIVVRVGGGFKSLQVFMDERALMLTREAAGAVSEKANQALQQQPDAPMQVISQHRVIVPAASMHSPPLTTAVRVPTTPSAMA